MSNLLALPLVQIVGQVSNNEDWIDTLVYLVGDGTDPNAPQCDLRGINFQMEIRRTAGDHEVVLQASTTDGSLSVGAPPNIGFLIIHVPLDSMKYVTAAEYVGDIVGNDGSYQRKLVDITQLTVNQGVTIWQ